MIDPLLVITFALPGPAVPKGRPRLGRGGRVYTPRRTHAYERAVHMAALADRPSGWPMDARMSCEILIGGSRRADVDNVAKSILDGLNGAAWADDSQVDRLVVERVPGPDGTSVVVRPIGPARKGRRRGR